MSDIEKLDYDAWVDYCFGRSVEDPPWHTQYDGEGNPLDWYEPASDDLAKRLRKLFENAALLPQRFTQEQIAQGLWYVSGGASGYLYAARESSVPAADQIAWVNAITFLYDEVFSPFCSHHYGHLDSGPESPTALNGVCYMFWDRDQLEGAAMFPGHEHLIEPIFTVLSHALFLKSPACNESALHSLGHLQMYHGDTVTALIDRYLARADLLTPELSNYAREARRGMVQ